MKRKASILLGIISIYLFSFYALKAQNNTTYSIPLVGNSFEIGHVSGSSTVGRSSVNLSANNKNITRVYFKLQKAGQVNLKLKGSVNTSATLFTDFGGVEKEFKLSSSDKIISLGEYQAVEGYVYLDVKSLNGQIALTDLEVSGSATENGMLYCNDPEFYYWARRGPSCHLSYTIPTRQNVSYYYNEIVVPEGQDVIGSYYMANGFGEGYFGIQVNSSTERRVLFSVWSPYHTDDPKSIPEDQQIKMLKKGDGVHTGEFGNEGSGGQSYLKYNWKAAQTYKFLLKGVPDGNGNTDYTAWFYMPEKKDWSLIASFKRPKTDTYLKGFHSFLENFMPTQGYLTRKVDFNNQWVHDGAWKKVQSAKLSVDNTYNSKQRVDATGGKTDTGYYLKMGGFFNDIVVPGSKFEFLNNNKAPEIDFSKLP